MIKRTFYPVGQGAFYSECHYIDPETKITIVYDCGSDDLVALETEIEKCDFSVIDILVLSHFHRDHINGIKFLLAREITIKTVVIPKLSNLDIALYAISLGDDFRILKHPSEMFPNSQIIQIRHEDESDSNEESEPISILEIGNESKDCEINHATTFKLGDEHDWILKFYIDQTVFSKKLTIKDKGALDAFGASDLNNPHEIRKMCLIYKSLARDINLTSMSMFSGPKTPWRFRHRIIHQSYFGILLNGDAFLKTEKKIKNLVNHFKKYAGCIGFFGIPHHGSHHNMSRVLGEFPIHTAVIQSGKYSKHGHPSYPIVQMHIDRRIRTEIVTEKSSEFIAELLQ